MFGLSGIFFGGLGIAALFAVSLAHWLPAHISDLSRQLAEEKHQVELIDARATAYQRGNERRDAAIAASKCKDQIQYWVRHPDEIPGQFDPFNQLQPQNTRTPGQ